MQPGQAFVKTWRIQNDGNCPWPPGTHVAFWSGETLGVPAGATNVGGLESGQTTDISLRMTAPDTEGTYKGVWALFDENGQVFGTLLTVVIQVGIPTPVPPTPTATPEPPTPTVTPIPVTPTAAPSHPGAIQEGPASFYSPTLDGAGTASGETYRNDLLTAAHRTLPFGTRVRVTNLRNGRSVEVVINDRGPFSRILVIDVSYRAAQELEMISAGIVEARIEVLE
jgi:rare lipoprotein A